MKKKSKSKKTIITFIQIILIIVILFSAYKIFTYYYENWNSTRQLNEATKIVKEIESLDNKDKKTRKKTKKELDELAKEVIKNLREKKNKDIVAFIKFDEAKINFPVVYVKGDNSYYLWRDLDGNDSRPGTIFMNGFNDGKFDEMNTTLFGHHLRTNADMFAPMFKLLLNLADKKNVDPNKEYFIEIYTDKGYKKYKVFSAYYSNAYDDYIKVNREKSEWVDYQKNVRSKSINKFKFNDEFNKNSKMLTLSTCDNATTEYGEDGRFVVHAIEVTDY